MNEDQLFPVVPDEEREPVQGHYIVIPTMLFEDTRLLAVAKLLYGLISSFARKNGECTASNKTLAARLSLQPRTVVFWLDRLEKCGYIRREVNRKAAKEMKNQRSIFISDEWRGWYATDCAPGMQQIVRPVCNGLRTSNNNTAISPFNNPPKGERATCFSFSEFWEMYGKKIGRAACERKYAKIGEADREQIKKTLPRYIESTPNIQYRLNPQTYLNGRRWEDEIPEPAAPASQSDPNAETYRKAEEMRRRWQE